MTPHYCKLADSVVDAGLGPYAGWLYTVIVRHMNRKCNELRKTVKELAALAGMSAKSVMRYTKLLEAKNLLHVHRSQTAEIADVNVYSLVGEAAQTSLFNGVPVSPPSSPSQSLGAVPQSPRKDSDSEMNTSNEEKENQSQSERDFQPEGIDQSKFLQDDPSPNPEDAPRYLRQQAPSTLIRQQLAAYLEKLGRARYIEVMTRCANAHSWEYVIKALTNEPAATPRSAPPPSADEISTEPDWVDEDETPDIDARRFAPVPISDEDNRQAWLKAHVAPALLANGGVKW